MPRYTCDPRMEVSGQTAMALIVNLEHDQIKPILETHGIGRIDPKQWYPVQKLLDVFSDVSELSGAMFNFVAVGMAAGELGAKNLPSEMKAMSLEDFLLTYAQIWQTRHRNADPDQMKAEKVDHHHIKIIGKTPYPDDILYGIFFAYARFFLKRSFVVKYDENTPRRDQGGEETIIHVRWE